MSYQPSKLEEWKKKNGLPEPKSNAPEPVQTSDKDQQQVSLPPVTDNDKPATESLKAILDAIHACRNETMQTKNTATLIAAKILETSPPHQQQKPRWAPATAIGMVIGCALSLALSGPVAFALLTETDAWYKQRCQQLYTEQLTRLQVNEAFSGTAAKLGLRCEMRRSETNDSYFILIKGAKKMANPQQTPEGLAVEVWTTK